MGQAVEGDLVAGAGDPPEQRRMAGRLVAEAEPGGPGPQVVAQVEGAFRGQFQAVFEMVQGPGAVEGRAAKLEPVLPVDG